jgi:hypothetical protein
VSKIINSNYRLQWSTKGRPWNGRSVKCGKIVMKKTLREGRMNGERDMVPQNVILRKIQVMFHLFKLSFYY